MEVFVLCPIMFLLVVTTVSNFCLPVFGNLFKLHLLSAFFSNVGNDMIKVNYDCHTKSCQLSRIMNPQPSKLNWKQIQYLPCRDIYPEESSFLLLNLKGISWPCLILPITRDAHTILCLPLIHYRDISGWFLYFSEANPSTRRTWDKIKTARCSKQGNW